MVRIAWVLVIAALAGCANAPLSDGQNALIDDANDMSMNADPGPPRVYPGANAVAGDVIPGQEIMLERRGLAVGVIQLHPGQFYEFGRPQADIVAMATNLRGRPTGSGRDEQCREGPIDYVEFGNLRLNFQDGRFVGWDAAPGEPRLRDEWSFGIGSPRNEIDDMGDINHVVRVARTTRGIEFDSNGYRGLLSSSRPDAIVTDLWAGMVCAPR